VEYNGFYLYSMFVRLKTYPNNHYAVQIVESYRDGQQVRQRIVRHVGRAQTEMELTKLKELAEYIIVEMNSAKDPTLFPATELAQMVIDSRHRAEADSTPLNVNLKKLREEHRIITGIHDIYGKLFDQAGYQNLLKNCPISRQVLKDITLARIARPSSKMASVDFLEKDFGITHSLDAVYRMMDHLDENKIEKIKSLTFENTRQLYAKEISVLFYDCTTLYFESFTEDELKEYGYSKDHKFNQSQVLLALLVTTDGLPVGYEVFNGSMFEGNTLETILKKVKKQYRIERAVFVADSGLLSKENIEKLQESGIEYIVGARLKSLSKQWQDTILDNRNHIKEQNKEDVLRYSSFKYDSNRTLIVSHSLKRAEKDRHDREKAIARLQSRLSKSSDIKSLISNYGYKKYIKSTGVSKVEVNLEKVNQDAQWDGLHGVYTNIPNADPKEILAHYRGLWQIEESFRINKHDLKMRPIFHWSPPRIKAHLAICYMAFSLVRTLQNIIRKQYQMLSPEVIKDELVHLQASILKHQITEDRYVVPSKPGKHAVEIYKILGLQYQTVPFKLTGKN
jgi:transposase